MNKTKVVALFMLVLWVASCAPPAASPQKATAPAADNVLTQFEGELEALRQQLNIPGLSAAIVRDQELVWAKGFGYADLENQVAAMPDTPYRLASVTKPIAATLLMQLVEEGKLSLDDPVSKYGVELESGGVIQVWHLLTHTSEGIPGTRHNYDGNRYSYLGAVMEGATGKPFGELLSERILEPLDMANSAPSYPDCAVQGIVASPDASERERNQARVNMELARPYQLDASYDVVEGLYPAGFSPAAGLISTVADLAKFDIALDRGTLLGDEAKAQMFEPAVSTYEDRSDLMYGLGWYVQQYQDTRLLWHTGRWAPSVSSLYLKAPDQQITFIVLANTANLTTPFPLGNGDVLYSTLAHTFYKTFVFPSKYAKAVPDIDWESKEFDLVNRLEQVTDDDVREVLERELWSYRQLYASVGRGELADRLLAVHRQAFGASRASALDLYAVRGVDYQPVASAKMELPEAALAQFVGKYVSGDIPEIAADSLPTEISIELKQGKLLGVAADMGCISLVPITPTQFAIRESPGVTVAFGLEGATATTLTVGAGELAAVYSVVD